MISERDRKLLRTLDDMIERPTTTDAERENAKARAAQIRAKYPGLDTSSHAARGTGTNYARSWGPSSFEDIMRDFAKAMGPDFSFDLKEAMRRATADIREDIRREQNRATEYERARARETARDPTAARGEGMQTRYRDGDKEYFCEGCRSWRVTLPCTRCASKHAADAWQRRQKGEGFADPDFARRDRNGRRHHRGYTDRTCWSYAEVRNMTVMDYDALERAGPLIDCPVCQTLRRRGTPCACNPWRESPGPPEHWNCRSTTFGKVAEFGIVDDLEKMREEVRSRGGAGTPDIDPIVTDPPYGFGPGFDVHAAFREHERRRKKR